MPKVGKIVNVLRRIGNENVNARLLGQITNGELVIWWERFKVFLNANRSISVLAQSRLVSTIGKLLYSNKSIKFSTKKNLISGPASETAIDSNIYAKPEADAIHSPAIEAETKKNIFVTVKAAFIAYKRAAVVYTIDIFTKRKSALISSVGAVARSTKAVSIFLKSELISASAKVLRSTFKKVQVKRKVHLKSAASRLVSTLKKNALKRTATLITGKTLPGAYAKEDIYLKTKREATTGTSSEVEAEKKLFVSVRAAFIAYNRAAALYLHNIIARLRSGLSTGVGTLAESRRILQQGQISEAGAADSENIVSLSNITAESQTNINHAPPEDINALTAVFNGIGAVLGFFYPPETWVDPQFEDGVLYIWQAYTANQKDNIVDIDYWVTPIFTDGVLYIQQAESTEQNDDTVIIDLYWKAPELTDEVLYIQSVNKAGQHGEAVEIDYWLNTEQVGNVLYIQQIQDSVPTEDNIQIN